MRRMVVVAMVLTLTMFGGAAPAPAVSGSCGAQANFHAGWNGAAPTDPGLGYEGASAQVQVRWGNVCAPDSGTDNFSNGWVMAASRDLLGWMQVGFERYYNSRLYHFTQWTCDGFNVSTPPCGFTAIDGALGYISPGSNVTYKVQYAPNCTPQHSCEQAVIGATAVSSTWWNPFAYWVAPFQPQWAEETSYTESDVPGESPAQTRFRNMFVQRYSDDTWTATIAFEGMVITHPRALVSNIASNTFYVSCSALCDGTH